MTDTNEKITFRPINEGLGFHPFSDGLPYAPVGKNPKASTTEKPVIRRTFDASVNLKAPALQGSGATVAGPVRWTPPAGRTISVPTAVQKAQPKPVEPVPAPVVQPELPAMGLSYPLFRTLAFGMDTVLHITLASLAMGYVVWSENIRLDRITSPSTLIFAALFFLFFNWAMIAAQETVLGTTAGKRLFGMELGGSAGARFVRSVLFLPSILCFGLGVMGAVFNRRKACWHDLAMGLQPEYSEDRIVPISSPKLS